MKPKQTKGEKAMAAHRKRTAKPTTPPLPKGWECPGCHLIYSPEVDRCFCAQNKAKEAEKTKEQMEEAKRQFIKQWAERAKNLPPPEPPRFIPRERPFYSPPPYYIPVYQPVWGDPWRQMQ